MWGNSYSTSSPTGLQATNPFGIAPLFLGQITWTQCRKVLYQVQLNSGTENPWGLHPFWEDKSLEMSVASFWHWQRLAFGITPIWRGINNLKLVWDHSYGWWRNPFGIAPLCREQISWNKCGNILTVVNENPSKLHQFSGTNYLELVWDHFRRDKRVTERAWHVSHQDTSIASHFMSLRLRSVKSVNNQENNAKHKVRR